MRRGWRTPRADSLKRVNYTRIENAFEVRKKIMWLLYGLLLRGKNRYELVGAVADPASTFQPCRGGSNQ